MVISAAARAAAKILAKQKYAKTAREWRKKNPDKIKAQKKRYYAAHKEQLIKEQKQWRKDNPEKVRQLRQAAKERQPKPVHTKKQLHFIEWNKRIEARKIAPKPTPGIFAVWTREQKTQSGFSAFLKGFGKQKSKPTPKLKGRQILPNAGPFVRAEPTEPISGPRKFGFGYEKSGKRKKWHVAHPTHARLLSLGGIFGGLAAYTNWNRGKKQ